jgi:hypothetical protein
MLVTTQFNSSPYSSSSISSRPTFEDGATASGSLKEWNRRAESDEREIGVEDLLPICPTAAVGVAG